MHQMRFEEKGRGPFPLQKLQPKSATRGQSQKEIAISRREFHSDRTQRNVKVGERGGDIAVIPASLVAGAFLPIHASDLPS
jgi:hypothetical protein